MRLIHRHRHIDLEVISRQRGGVETPTSPFIVLRHAGKRLTLVTIISKKFSDTMGLRCRHAPITTMVLGICLSTADICKPTVAHSLQRASCLGVLPRWSQTGHVCVNVCLSFDVHVASSIPNFSSVPKNCTRDFFSHQPTATPLTVVSDIHYRRARVTFEIRTSLL